MKRVISFLPWLGALLLVSVALLSFESDLLWKIQQCNLFLDTSLYFHEQMLVPGGLLTYVSCYLIQFFYYPWLGVLMLCGWWLLLMWLTKRTFRIDDRWTVIALIPVAALLVADMCLGYWHYIMRLRGYFLVPTIGTVAAVAMLWAFRVLPKKPWMRICVILVAAAIGYPLLGIYALAAVMLMGVWGWKLAANRSQGIILTAVALLCIVAVPLIYYRYIYYQTYFNDLWTSALPVQKALKDYPAYLMPHYLLAVFFLLMVLIYQSPLLVKPQKTLFRWSVQGILVFVLIVGVWHWWYKDENFHHELVMQHCIEETDWEGVIDEGKKQIAEPTRAIIIMHNIALSRLGRQCDEMFDFPWGRRKVDPNTPYDMLQLAFSKMIYYNYGLLNDCHRKSMEDGVEYGWQVESLKYLARCSILSGEKRAAQKILNKLRHTAFYGKWADDMQQLLDNPKQITENRETGPIRHLSQFKNLLGFDEGNIEKFMQNVFAYQDSKDPLFQEQAVIATLQKRNAKLFWARFNHYTRLFPHGPIPRIFQEAAILFGHIDNKSETGRIPFDKGVKENYNAFMREARKYGGQQPVVGRTALYPFFGNTYYFYYYFLNDLQ